MFGVFFFFPPFSRLLSYLKSQDKVRGWELIFFCCWFDLIPVLAEVVLKASVVLVWGILKGRFSSLRSPSLAKVENQSKF